MLRWNLPTTVFRLHFQNQICIIPQRSMREGSKCNPIIKKGPKLVKIVLLRHGQSEWNEKNLFCGWYDSPLTYKGFLEAKAAGETLRNLDYTFDYTFTSVLTRARQTLQEVMLQLKLRRVPVIKSWRLNERHYGSLTGLNKTETVAKYGQEQVNLWRRGFSERPPKMKKDHKYYKIITGDKRYAGVLPSHSFPRSESLKNTIARMLPFWNEAIVPKIKAQKKVLIVAHGNTLRGIIKILDDVSDKNIMGVNLPTGIPIVFTVDVDTMKPTMKYKFLGDQDAVDNAIKAMETKGEAKGK